MEAVGWHITARLSDDRVIAADAVARRRAADALLRAGAARGLLAARVVDTHVHALVTGTREDARQFVRGALSSMVQRVPLVGRFERARVRRVEDQRHLRNTFEYILRNDRRHGVEADRWHDGSNLVDLLGLRVTGVYTALGVRRALPRVGRADLLAHLGLSELPAGPVDARHLVESAAAAAGLDALTGRTAEVVAARAAAVAVGVEAGWDPEEVARWLGVSERSVRRLRAGAVDPALVSAVRRQCAWRTAVPEPETPVFV